MKKAATPDELLNTEIKIVDEGESGIEMTAEERRKKKEEEKAKVEEKKKVEEKAMVEEKKEAEEAILLVEEEKKKEAILVEKKKKMDETNTETRGTEKATVDETGVEAIPPSPVQQMTLPYMKRKEEGENIEVEEAFSYFSSSTSSSSTLTASKVDSHPTTVMGSTMNDVDMTFEESTDFPTTSTVILESTTITTVVGSTTNTFEEEPTITTAMMNSSGSASVVLEAQAIVAAVIGEASFISSFDSSRSKSREEEEEDDPLGEERNFSAVNREMLSDSDFSEVNDDETDGLGLLEEIKEEIMKEEEKKTEEEEEAILSKKKNSYKRPGTWTNITITSNLVQNMEEEPMSPAEDKELDNQDERLAKQMSEWKAPKAIAHGGGEVRVKEVAMVDSPLVDARSGRLVKEAGDMNLYSGIFSVMTEDKEREEVKKEERTSKEENGEQRNGEILALLPHFLSFSSCSKTEVENLRVLVLHFPSGQLSLLKPILIEDDNFAIYLPGSALVALVSPLPALHVRAVLIPFCAQAPPLAPLAIALLPDSPATLLNLPTQLHGWKKIGYEQQCCVRRGESLMVRQPGQDGQDGHSGEGGQGVEVGQGGDLSISLLTPPQNASWATWVGRVNGDFLDTSITMESTGLIVHAGPLPLYSSLKVERDAPQFLSPPPPPPVHPETLADRPSYGKTTNLEPLFAAIRNGGLSEKSLEELSSQLGADGKGVMEAVGRWKEREGESASLAAFLQMLQKPEVSLLAVEREIRQNEENSRCGIPALAIH